MGHQASRPIVVEVVDDGVYYVPVARDRSKMTVNANAGGLTGVAVDWTNDNIIRGPASSYDVNLDASHVLPVNAVWEVLQANVITTAVVGVSIQPLALRLTGTGTGTARVVITQET